MTGKDFINLIIENGLENYEITDGHLELSDDDTDESIMVYPVKFSDKSGWPTFPMDFKDWTFNQKCDWYVEFLFYGKRKPFTQIERVPKSAFEIVDAVFDGTYRNNLIRVN